jgi:hypothetical protein
MLRVFHTAPLVLALIMMLLLSSLPPARLYSQPDSAPAAVPRPAQTTPPNRLYLPLMVSALGPPSLVIRNPLPNTVIGGTTQISAEALVPGSVTQVNFRIGERDLGTDSTPNDGFSAFVDASDLPAGTATISLIARGPAGERTQTVAVTIQPNPTTSATIGRTGGVLGTTSGATITIPPDALSSNTTVSIRERTQAEVTSEAGIVWDDIGVTFLGDVAISSEQPLNRPVGVSTQGFANRIQPGQAVVTYNLLPDQDGDGVGELVVASMAEVAPNGAIVSTSDPQLRVNSLRIGTAQAASTAWVQPSQAGLSAVPGALIEIDGAGLNASAVVGNEAIFRSTGSGQSVTMPLLVSTRRSTSSTQNVVAMVPFLPAGPATLTLRNPSSGLSSPSIALTISPPAALSKPAATIITEGLQTFTDALDRANAPISARLPDSTGASRSLAAINQFRSEVERMSANPTADEQQFLLQTATLFENSGLFAAVSANLLGPGGIAQSDPCSPATLVDVGQINALGWALLGAGVVALAFGGIPVFTAALMTSAGLHIVPITWWIQRECAQRPPNCPAQTVAIAAQASLATEVIVQQQQCEPPPPCAPSANGGGTPASRGIGGAPPPGGNGCGNATGGGGGGGGGGQAQIAQTNTNLAGRYIVRIFPQAGGRALSPFTGASDAGGYFFLPFIPEGEPFRAVAVDTVTGASRTFDGVGPATGDSVYMFFDFVGAEENRFPITFGDTVSDGVPSAGAGNIENAGAFDIYTFEAEPDREVRFELISRDDTLRFSRWKLVSPSGTEVFARTLGTTGIIALPEPGTYTLTVGDDSSGGTGTYSFQLIGIPLPDRFSIPLDSVVSNGVPGAGAGNIEQPFVKDYYTFTATAGQQVFIDRSNIGSGMSQIDWRLVDEVGTEIFRTCLGCTNPGVRTLTRGGTYTLTVGDNTDPATGTYSFRVLAIDAPEEFVIAIGDTVSDGVPAAGAGNIESPGGRDVYTFTATAGQQVRIERISVGTGMSQIDWRLVDAEGNVVFSTCLGCSQPEVRTLTLGGIYTLTVGDNNDPATGTYSFRITEVVAP